MSVEYQRKFASVFGSVLPEEGFAAFLVATVPSTARDSLKLFSLPERRFYEWLAWAAREATARAVARLAIRPLAFDDFARQAQESIRQEPVLDGVAHAGETVLRRGFACDPVAAGRWALALVRDPSQPSFSADILRLLCRIKPASPDWRHAIVEAALGSPSMEVRDAAIQAVESWAERDLTDLLRGHAEPDRFLADYAAQVLRDLGEG